MKTETEKLNDELERIAASEESASSTGNRGGRCKLTLSDGRVVCKDLDQASCYQVANNIGAGADWSPGSCS